MCLLMLFSCQRAVDTFNVSNTAPAKTAPIGFTLYTIPKGQHFAASNSFQPVNVDALQFMVQFDSSAIYQSIVPEINMTSISCMGFLIMAPLTISIAPVLAGHGPTGNFGCMPISITMANVLIQNFVQFQ